MPTPTLKGGQPPTQKCLCIQCLSSLTSPTYSTAVGAGGAAILDWNVRQPQVLPTVGTLTAGTFQMKFQRVIYKKKKRNPILCAQGSACVSSHLLILLRLVSLLHVAALTSIHVTTTVYQSHNPPFLQCWWLQTST